MTKQAKTKLTKLANFLATKVKPKWFLLKTWASSPGFKQKECGTTACAVGWATMAFKGEGLALENIEHGEPGDPRTTVVKVVYQRRGVKKLSNFDAAAAFFDIDVKSSEFLFNPSCYRWDKNKKQHVVARIRSVVKTGKYVATDCEGGGEHNVIGWKP